TSKPRVSNITFSTVTSATGLPTIAAEPCRPRSSSSLSEITDKESDGLRIPGQATKTSPKMEPVKKTSLKSGPGRRCHG
ncbi:hypothetical protein TELCIR_25280, partial [Teladorsagia circumcincta]